MTNSERKGNYDLLRILCSVAVIFIHVSVKYISVEGENFAPCLFDCIFRYTIPCFVMLSGTFILEDNYNAYYKSFYKKSFDKIVVPTIVFSVLYILFEYFMEIIKYMLHKEVDFIIPLKQLIRGEPYYHMWYMYMLIVVYFFIPIIIRLKNDVGEKILTK